MSHNFAAYIFISIFLRFSHGSEYQDNETSVLFIDTFDEWGQQMTIARRIKLTSKPTQSPTKNPTESPTQHPTNYPTLRPTKPPTLSPTLRPTKDPTIKPTKSPTMQPTVSPTKSPTEQWDSKISARISNSKKHNKGKAKSQSAKLSDSQLLKNAMKAQLQTATQSESDQKQKQKASADSVDVFIYDSTLNNDLVSKFVSRLVDNPLYKTVFADGDIQSAPFNCLLQHNLDFIKILHQGKFDGKVLSTFIADSILLFASLSDESLYQRIVKDIYDEFKQDSNNIYDSSFDYLLTDGYQSSRKELESGQAPTMMQYGFVDTMDYRYIELMIMYTRITSKHLIDAQISKIERIFTNSSYGKDGKIPVKIRRNVTNLRQKQKHLNSKVLLAFSQSLLIFFDPKINASNNSNAIEMKERTHIWNDVKLLMVDIWHICTAIGTISMPLQIVQCVYDWKRSDKKHNHGTIAISASSVGDTQLIEGLLKNIGYSSTSIHPFIVHIVNGDLIVKNRRTRSEADKASHHLTSEDKIKLFVVDDTAKHGFIEKELNITNNESYNLVLTEYPDSVIRSTIKQNRHSLFEMIDAIFGSSYVMFTRYMEILSDIDGKPKSEREKFKQGTVFLVGEVLHYLRTLDRYDHFRQSTTNSFGEEFWKLCKLIEEHRQNITLLRSEMMTEDLMKDSWKFIDLYIMMITQFAIQEMDLNLQNSRVAEMDHGIRKYYEKQCNKVEEIASLVPKLIVWFDGYYNNGNKKHGQCIKKSVGLMRDFQRELATTKKVLQIVLSIHEWKLKGNTGIIAIILKQSLMSTNFLDQFASLLRSDIEVQITFV